MLRLAPENYSVSLTECFVGKQNIFGRGEKNVFSARNWFEYWSSKFSCCLASFASSFAFNDMLKHVESEAMLQKPLNKWRLLEMCSKALMGVSAGPKFNMGVRQNWTYLLSENMKIVSKRISELPFFFSTYAFVRTFESEQISSNVHFFLVEFHWLGWNSTLLFFEVTNPS